MSLADQISHLKETFRRNGYRLTLARRTIITALVEGDAHITADELVETVRQSVPGIGRMTVYRTLIILADLGLVRPVYQGTAAASYVLMEQGHHHHLVCTLCGRVIDFDHCALVETEKAMSDRFRFSVDGHLLEIFGQCFSCRKNTGRLE